MVIDDETASKIKRALAEIISKDVKHKLMKNKLDAKLTSTNDSLLTEIFIEPCINI